jgi:prephenate dehydrogenase
VIGLGLIGGSWAGALQALDWQVWGINRHTRSLDQALERGWIRGGWMELPAHLDVDLVVVALPLGAAVEILPSLAQRLDAGTIVTDVGSMKTMICAASSVLTDKGIHFIGGHPMTGSEKSGFSEAKRDLFRGYPYVLTPLEDCPAVVVEEVSRLVTRIQARLVYRDPANHDQEVALISHIPHVLSVALALAAGDMREQGSEALELAGRSFREITRIADSSPDLWSEILANNNEAILAGLKLYRERLDALRGYIERRHNVGIAEAFAQARNVLTDLK